MCLLCSPLIGEDLNISSLSNFSSEDSDKWLTTFDELGTINAPILSSARYRFPVKRIMRKFGPFSVRITVSPMSLIYIGFWAALFVAAVYLCLSDSARWRIYFQEGENWGM